MAIADQKNIAFTEFVILKLGILFFVRMPLSVFSNIWLLSTIFLSILFQLLVLYFPSMHLPFGTVFLDALSWLQILRIACGVNLLVFFVIRFVKAGKER